MTTTYEFVAEAVTNTLLNQIALYVTLGDRPDVKDRSEVLSDILTLFSLETSIIQPFRDINETITQRVDRVIEDYYKKLNKGSANVVGISAAQTMRSELLELVYTAVPLLEKETWTEFYRNLPHSNMTAEDKSALTDTTVVLICILVCIKTECMLIKINAMMHETKGNRYGRNSQTAR